MNLARFIPSRLRDILDTYSDLTFNVKAYGAAGDGSTDDTSAIQAAITAAALVGGIVFFPPGRYKITSTLNVTSPVTLRGVGITQNLFDATSPSTTTGSRLIWGGAAGGTMVNLCPATGASDPVSGAAIDGLMIDGQSTSPTTGAGIGVRVAAAAQCVLRNLFIRECTTACLKLDGSGDGTFTGLDDVYSCSFEKIWIYNVASGGDGVYIGGAGAYGFTGGGKAPSFCTFRHFHITYKNGNGITFAEGDDCVFYMIGISGGPTIGGTGVGVRFKASASQFRAAQCNAFFHLWPSQGGVYAEGTTSNTWPSNKNAIYGYADQDNPPDPVVEDGASLLVEKTSGDRYAYSGAGVGVGVGAFHSIANGNSTVHFFDAYGSSAIELFRGRRGRGSLNAPRRAKNTDTLLAIDALGFHAADDSSTATADAAASARIRFSATEDHTASAQGADFEVDTVAAGATSLVHRLSVTDAGLDLLNAGKVYNALPGTLTTHGATLANSLDQFAVPTGDTAWNGKEITGLKDPTAAQSAATRNYTDVKIAGALAATLGYQAWNYDPRLPIGGAAPGTQIVFYEAIWLPAGAVITGVVLAVTTAGTSTAPAHFYVGLYNSALNRVAVSNNLNSGSSQTDGTGNLKALGTSKFAFTGAYTVPSSGLYYLAILKDGAFAGTDVQFAYLAGVTGGYPDTPIPGGSLYVSAHQIGQTSLPSSMTPGANAASFWMGLY